MTDKQKIAHTPGEWEAADRGDYGDFDGNSRVILGDDMRVAVIQHPARHPLTVPHQHPDRRFVREMLHAGASGYLLKDCAFEELTSFL